jgi:HPt (histidine-containing phosphotransfer) domain-containing protein
MFKKERSMIALNWNKEFAMEQAADDVELLEELLEIFKDSLKVDIGLIEQGLTEKNAEKISGAAHSIKGAAASLGINGINDVAMLVEKDSRDGGFEAAEDNLENLQKLLTQLIAL